MNRRDQQIADLAAQTEGLDLRKLVERTKLVRDSYESSSVIGDFSLVQEIADRTPSDFRVLTNSEARRTETFNAPNVEWEWYCKELGRSVALGEQAYFFEVLRERLQPITITSGVGFEGLEATVLELVDRGHSPDTIVGPIAHMVGFFNFMKHRALWEGGRQYVVLAQRRMRMLWSAMGRPIDKFVVFNHQAGRWRVKLDPSTGSRITVAIGMQPSPPGVLWLAETVAKYEITHLAEFMPFLPDEALDRRFSTVR